GGRTLSGFYGSFSSPDYGARAGSRRPAYDCRWRIDTGDRRPLLLSFPGLALGDGDRLEVWEGGEPGARPLAELSTQDNTEWEVGGSVLSVGTATGSASVRYVSTGGRGRAGFNATYQVRGFCPPWQHPCLDGGTPSCYSAQQRCDGVWHCEGGRDEEGCGGCPAGHYPCGGRSRACYSPAERCDYQTNCPGGMDERGCRHCQPGTFHCADDRCIFETWACDGQPDCADGSDERDCEHPLPRKVVTAAVVGSLVCALLLVVAMGCTCKLYSLRTSHYSLFTPLAHMEAVQRRAPPSYGELIAQGAIPPVEDFPTENPNDMSVIGNIRSILQLLRQESPQQTARRRRRYRYIRRLARRFRRTRLYALLSRSTPRAGPAPATIPEAAATPAPEPTATDHPSSSAGAVPLPRKFPLLEGCPPPAAPDLPGRQPAGTAASVFWGLSRRSRGAEGEGPPANGRDMLLLPLTEASEPRESADSDEEALLC
ncbi:LOW QUALITY PROTEIN: low-density lipoprotein receptor-related protein 10-like, partial [Heterodontus francisci]|uniref:LOW QUALITY PROTEIN: low-density lipoprotein receptor-related protein 10-like n=1 Tax=Heterodontus francisci TaxID=7792 RepID=UPI00355B59D4